MNSWLNPGQTLSITVVVLFLLTFLIFYLLKRFIALYQNYAERKWKTQKEAEKILDRARKESISLIHGAEKKAENILGDAGRLKTQAETDVEKTIEDFSLAEGSKLSKVAREFNDSYRVMLGELKDLHQAYIREAVKELHSSLEREYPKYLEDMKRGVREAQEAARVEILAYRDQKFAEMEKSIPEIVAQVSMDVLGRNLSISDHADLALRALARAKKEHFFDRPTA